jgi:hypothetical protein
MVYIDKGQTGVFEPQNDTPLVMNGTEVRTSFTVTVNQTTTQNISISIQQLQQLLVNGSITVDNVSGVERDGWLVIHNDSNGTPGEVIGYAPVQAGANNNITVVLNETALQNITTGTYFAMLHVDLGTPGVFEPDLDIPVEMNGEPVMVAFEVQ